MRLQQDMRVVRHQAVRKNVDAVRGGRRQELRGDDSSELQILEMPCPVRRTGREETADWASIVLRNQTGRTVRHIVRSARSSPVHGRCAVSSEPAGVHRTTGRMTPAPQRLRKKPRRATSDDRKNDPGATAIGPFRSPNSEFRICCSMRRGSDGTSSQPPTRRHRRRARDARRGCRVGPGTPSADHAHVCRPRTDACDTIGR